MSISPTYPHQNNLNVFNEPIVSIAKYTLLPSKVTSSILKFVGIIGGIILIPIALVILYPIFYLLIVRFNYSLDKFLRYIKNNRNDIEVRDLMVELVKIESSKKNISELVNDKDSDFLLLKPFTKQSKKMLGKLDELDEVCSSIVYPDLKKELNTEDLDKLELAFKDIDMSDFDTDSPELYSL